MNSTHFGVYFTWRTMASYAYFFLSTKTNTRTWLQPTQAGLSWHRKATSLSLSTINMNVQLHLSTLSEPAWPLQNTSQYTRAISGGGGSTEHEHEHKSHTKSHLCCTAQVYIPRRKAQNRRTVTLPLSTPSSSPAGSPASNQTISPTRPTCRRAENCNGRRRIEQTLGPATNGHTT